MTIRGSEKGRHLRVAYITMGFPVPSETFACRDIRALQRAGHQISVFALRNRPRNLDQMLYEHGLGDLAVSWNSLSATMRGLALGLQRPGAVLVIAGALLRWCWSRPDHLARSFLLAPAALNILDQIRRNRPDVVHLFWGHFPAIVGRLLLAEKSRPLLSVFLGSYDLTYGLGLTGPVAREADVVLTHAQVNMPDLLALGVRQSRIVLSYRGLDLSDGGAASSEARVPHRLITVGRLTTNRHVDDILSVLARLRETWPQASLVVLGDGNDRSRLLRLCRSKGLESAVTFKGHVSQTQVFTELSEAAALILMSRCPAERLPNAAKEALLQGCPCVVTATPGINELINDGVTGFVVDPGDTEAAVRRISELFASKELGMRMAQAGLEHLRDRFDVDQNMARHVNRWEQELANRTESVGLSSRELPTSPG